MIAHVRETWEPTPEQGYFTLRIGEHETEPMVFDVTSQQIVDRTIELLKEKTS